MKKALYSTGLRIDDDHLNYAELTKEEAIKERMTAMLRQHGVVASNTLGTELKVVAGTTAGYIKISPGEAYDRTGERIYLIVATGEIEVPNDGQERYVVIRYKYEDAVDGVFKTGYPQGTETSKTRRQDSYEHEILAPGQQPGANDVILAKVKRQGATVEIKDERGQNLLTCQLPDNYFEDYDATAPTGPTVLTLTTGFETDNYDDTRVLPSVMIQAWIRAEWDAAFDSNGIFCYLVELTELDTGGNPTNRVTTSTSSTLSYTWHGLMPGIQYKVGVCARDNSANHNQGSWIYNTITSGLADALVMSSITVTSAPFGVNVSWPAVNDALGYEVFARESSIAGEYPPTAPGTIDYGMLKYRGPARSIFIKGDKIGNYINVVVRCYSYGAIVSDFTSGYAMVGSDIDGYIHKHTNKPALDLINYTGANPTIDLKDIEDNKAKIDTIATTGGLKDNTVGTTQIKNNAVTTDKIADDAITDVKIGPNAINSTHLSDRCVTTGAIDDASVTTGKLAADVIDLGNEHIITGVLGTDHLPAPLRQFAKAVEVRFDNIPAGVERTQFHGLGEQPNFIAIVVRSPSDAETVVRLVRYDATNITVISNKGSTYASAYVF